MKKSKIFCNLICMQQWLRVLKISGSHFKKKAILFLLISMGKPIMEEISGGMKMTTGNPAGAVQ